VVDTANLEGKGRKGRRGGAGRKRGGGGGGGGGKKERKGEEREGRRERRRRNKWCPPDLLRAHVLASTGSVQSRVQYCIVQNLAGKGRKGRRGGTGRKGGEGGGGKKEREGASAVSMVYPCIPVSLYPCTVE
jgi:hypothetical protein